MIANAAEDRDVVTASLAGRFLATLGHPVRPFRDGDAAPPGLHWCLAPEYGAGAELEADGIAAGGIIPSLDLPHRLWAGATIRFGAPLRIGDTVHRRSQVVDVTRKAGRSGPLAFVRIGHRFLVDGEVRIDEEQTIVYRDGALRPDQPRTHSAASSATTARSVATDPAMLFRFSALTFNAHRIHYDLGHARSEGLPERLVHGPLTAALLLDVVPIRDRPVTVTLQALRPIPCGATIDLAETPSGAAAHVDGALVMTLVVGRG